MIVTKESLRKMLETHDDALRARIVGKALVVIFKNQTATEQRSNLTEQNNGIGFTGADARGGCLTAKSFIKNGTLLDWQVAKWTRPAKDGFPRLCKYYRQLNAAAEAKAAQQ